MPVPFAGADAVRRCRSPVPMPSTVGRWPLAGHGWRQRHRRRQTTSASASTTATANGQRQPPVHRENRLLVLARRRRL